MVIAVDFDGTITDKNSFPQIGEIKEYAAEAIHNLQKAGHMIILWTCREGFYLDEAKKWLKEHNIIIKFYNFSPYQLQSRKIVADVYIDDKNVFMVDNVDWHKIEEYILKLGDSRTEIKSYSND